MPVLTRMLPSPLHVDIRSGSVSGLGELLLDRFISAQGRVLVAVGPSQGAEIWRVLEGATPAGRRSQVAARSKATSISPWVRT